jgi:hypothetical protein
MEMRKVTCLLTIGALALALPAMAQTGGSGSTPPSTQAQVPQPSDNSVNWKGVGIGAGTVAGNVLYVPAKLVYGILGGITGAASYALTGGNTQTANTIWRSSLGGDYVLTPGMVSGKEPVHFSGPTTTPPSESTSPTSTSAANSTANQPATTASASGVSAEPIGSGSGSTPSSASNVGSGMSQPGDHGTGPVGGGSAAGPSGGSANKGVPAPPLPTGIE